MTHWLTHKQVLITGASSGIGRDFAFECAKHGAHLILVARRKERLEGVQTQIQHLYKTNCTLIVSDLAEEGAVDALLAQLKKEKLQVDVLINNAGRGLHGPSFEVPLAEEEGMVAINDHALHRLTRAVGADMATRGSGHILNVASIVGLVPMRMMAMYSASKAFVVSYSEALNDEFSSTGVKVSCVCPGFTATEFFDANQVPMSPMAKMMMMKSIDVVRASLSGLKRGKALIIPGIMNKLMILWLRLLPRKWGRVMGYQMMKVKET